MLDSLGHATASAESGSEALRLLASNQEIDLVLADFAMPEMSGSEFAKAIRAMRPILPVIFMTGYSDYPIVNDSGDTRIAKRRAIMKPFRPAELLAIVREVLDARSKLALAPA